MIERVSLFNSYRDFFIFLAFATLILAHSLYLEYKNYKKLARFDSFIATVSVLKQYEKTKDKKTYQVLKLKSDDGFSFYTIASKNTPNLKNHKLVVEAFAKDFTFLNYIDSFYANTKILEKSEIKNLKTKLTNLVASAHESDYIAQLYNALYFATDVDYDIRQIFSNLGISHIIAISGFHLGIISAMLYFIIKPIYGFFQNRHFPFRNANSDIFLLTSLVLLAYLLFLDTPPSLVRSLGMFVVGYVLYDRGVEVITMQTLLVAIVLLLAFFPRLYFAIGFWLSALGVFYIFLFVTYHKHRGWLYQLVGISVMVYLYMIPISLFIFGNFSLYHPISVPLSMLFSIFYPLSMLMHIVGFGNFLDGFLRWLLLVGQDGIKLEISSYVFYAHMLLSFLALKSRVAFYILNIFSFFIFVYAIYHVT
ncbi:MAG: ComEC/Rec2 family competence protein [Sulfurimonas sp.]|jgi:competence protein ComEC|nr:ComEC/Rec2 family competence protein [Sulfurimonadaceae bacterium]